MLKPSIDMAKRNQNYQHLVDHNSINQGWQLEHLHQTTKNASNSLRIQSKLFNPKGYQTMVPETYKLAHLTNGVGIRNKPQPSSQGSVGHLWLGTVRKNPNVFEEIYAWNPKRVHHVLNADAPAETAARCLLNGIMLNSSSHLDQWHAIIEKMWRHLWGPMVSDSPSGSLNSKHLMIFNILVDLPVLTQGRILPLSETWGLTSYSCQTKRTTSWHC